MKSTIVIGNYGKICAICMVIGSLLLYNGCENNWDTVRVTTGDETTDLENETFQVTALYALSENYPDHEDAGDYTDPGQNVTMIELNGESIAVTGEGVNISGDTAIIFAPGTFSVSGTLADGQIRVDCEDDGIVRILLNGVFISCSGSAPLYVAEADKTLVCLQENTTNRLSDGTTYVYEDPEEDEPDAALFSKDDLTIYGTGSLKIEGNYKDGIACKDGLIIRDGFLTIQSADDGIRGKDYLVLKGCDLEIEAGGDGVRSTNDEDNSRGYVYIEDCSAVISAGGDAIQAVTDVIISSGEFELVTGGGASTPVNETTSRKGLKAGVGNVIDAGQFTISSSDDAVHSNEYMSINGGSFTISTGDDAFHADSILGMNGGKIVIGKCYEGIESAIIALNDGEVHLTSSDDGINVASGNDGSGGFPGPGGPGRDNFASSGNRFLYVNGGSYYVNATGDGVDVNGSIVMTGGTIVVDGPSSDMNGAIDFDGSYRISGGYLLGTGSARMAQAPTGSGQYVFLVNFSSTLSAGTLVHLQSSAGAEIFTFEPTKRYQSVVFSSPDLKAGKTYELYYGGSSSGTFTDGLLLEGTYTPGNLYERLTCRE